MKYSRKQQIVSLFNQHTDGGYSEHDNRYIVNKREKGQKKLFICNCCGKEFDFTDSVDYVGAVDQWAQGGGKCYACAHDFCHCQEEVK